MGDDRPIRYEDGDKIIYRASGLGSCERAFVACANGTPRSPHPDWFQEVLDEGTEAEPLISAMWDAETGITTVDSQREYDLRIGTFNEREVYVRCHIDGRPEGAPGVLREYKKFRDTTWPDFLRRGVEVQDHYPWQVAVSMWAGGFDECEFVGGNWHNRGSEEAPDWHIAEVYRHHITNPPIPFKGIKDRVKRIERLIGVGFDAREVVCDKRMYPCPYFKLHDKDDQPDAFELPTDGEWGETVQLLVSNLAMSTSKHKMLKATADAAEEAKKRDAEALRVALEAIGPEAVAAKKLIAAEYEVVRVRKTTKAHMRDESKSDYFTTKVRKADK